MKTLGKNKEQFTKVLASFYLFQDVIEISYYSGSFSLTDLYAYHRWIVKQHVLSMNSFTFIDRNLNSLNLVETLKGISPQKQVKTSIQYYELFPEHMPLVGQKAKYSEDEFSFASIFSESLTASDHPLYLQMSKHSKLFDQIIYSIIHASNNFYYIDDSQVAAITGYETKRLLKRVLNPIFKEENAKAIENLRQEQTLDSIMDKNNKTIFSGEYLSKNFLEDLKKDIFPEVSKEEFKHFLNESEKYFTFVKSFKDKYIERPAKISNSGIMDIDVEVIKEYIFNSLKNYLTNNYYLPSNFNHNTFAARIFELFFGVTIETPTDYFKNQ